MVNICTHDGEYYLGDRVEGGMGDRGTEDGLFVNHISLSREGYVQGPEGEWIEDPNGRQLSAFYCNPEFCPAAPSSGYGFDISSRPNVLSRGNYWRRANCKPLEPFASPVDEAYFLYAFGDAYIPEDLQVDSKGGLRQCIQDGRLDGIFTSMSIFYQTERLNWYGVKLHDETKGRELAQRILTEVSFDR